MLYVASGRGSCVAVVIGDHAGGQLGRCRAAVVRGLLPAAQGMDAAGCVAELVLITEQRQATLVALPRRVGLPEPLQRHRRVDQRGALLSAGRLPGLRGRLEQAMRQIEVLPTLGGQRRLIPGEGLLSRLRDLLHAGRRIVRRGVRQRVQRLLGCRLMRGVQERHRLVDVPTGLRDEAKPQ